jgi:hypothetical protein
MPSAYLRSYVGLYVIQKLGAVGLIGPIYSEEAVAVATLGTAFQVLTRSAAFTSLRCPYCLSIQYTLNW